jgi:hypothetical protein
MPLGHWTTAVAFALLIVFLHDAYIRTIYDGARIDYWRDKSSKILFSKGALLLSLLSCLIIPTVPLFGIVVSLIIFAVHSILAIR